MLFILYSCTQRIMMRGYAGARRRICWCTHIIMNDGGLGFCCCVVYAVLVIVLTQLAINLIS
jgi:hypothetical protein